ncbi:MAG TPA: hypothetical protein VGD60_01880 [Candidatus Acidoferrales bacterium]
MAFSNPAGLRLLGCCGRWRTGRSPVLKTFPAIHRTPLRRLERNGSFLSALRANRLRFHSLCRSAGGGPARRAVCLACFTPLGLVLKTLVGEEHLLARSKNKLGRTFGAFQDPIVVFHTLLREKYCWSKAAEPFTPDEVESAFLFRASHLSGHELFEWTQTNGQLVLLTPLLFAETLTREGFFRTPPFTWFHVVAVLFDLFDDVLRLDLPLKSPERIL